MRRFGLPLLVLAIAVPFVAACGGSSKSPKSSTPSTVSDQQYLKVICTGLSNFSNALATKTKPEELSQTIKDYITSLQQVTPPADVEQFHQEFIKYLQDSVNDPTSLVTRPPPLPTGAVRQRLANVELQTPECKNAKFFTRPSN